MSDRLKLAFSAPSLPASGAVVVFVGDDLMLPVATRDLLGPAAVDAVARAAAAENFKGKALSGLTLLAPAGLQADRLVVVGLGTAKDRAETNFVTLGGAVMGRVGPSKAVTVLLDGPTDWAAGAEASAEFALGLSLRAYQFDKYKTRKSDQDAPSGAVAVTIGCADPAGARKAMKTRAGVAEGVTLARNLVNEPPNVLYPAEFAKRAEQLQKLGVEVEVLDARKLEKIGMRALLGVGQGSERESKVVIMRWNGARSSKAKPVAFVGKGVCFDTGGISIKPAGGMEDMKGDMAGAACVVGLMHALASRKAKANVIGAIGLVENMPDGAAQRPGDIVTSLSGQTIEIINTDAEGRLVLADVLWYVQDRFKPAFMIDLATLTGAIIVALGQENAGLFSNDDELAERLLAAGKATGEGVWRMPLAPAYDKIIDSKFADVKNSGGRHGGSITAAQFLKRFVNDTPWAHLDIAGTAMGSPASEVNRSWGSGWGVRLLNRLVADHYEG
ncbi:leucyl aminopeptidase [Alsobacter sp. SYSU M60028]|uniref:Probable cytosol aminopeptidase n=1 Tax=Alsobacter ponti TaxID=2962936 RepID=A0ABT1LHB8_9HYPH|nr:leucyl aminopeptidase [Alsobacter ponti]MCP8940268.1 leucyl aminopeptidase [Alsobacter ponti]